MGMIDRLYTALDDQLNAALQASAGRREAAALKGQLLLLSGQLTAAYSRYRRATDSGQEREAGKASQEMMQIEEQAIRLLQPYGLRSEIENRLRD